MFFPKFQGENSQFKEQRKKSSSSSKLFFCITNFKINVLMSGMLKELNQPIIRFFVLFDFFIQCMGESFQGYS